MATFPPLAPTTLAGILPAYVFEEYADDVNIQAFFSAFNGIAQQYQNWFNQVNLPIYTQPQIAGSLLDWVAAGIYGIERPSLPYGNVTGIGPLNTWGMNAYVLNTFSTSGVINDFTTTDDIFKRIITWFFFKGDGQQFSIGWLKRRIMRFLIGSAGTSPNIDNTYPISVTFGEGNSVAITITLSSGAPITLLTAQVFQAAVQSGAVSLPFQFSFSVAIINNLTPTNLSNNGGFLNVSSGAGYPTSATGLATGDAWSNGDFISIVPGITPNPFAAPLFFGVVTAAQLLVLGGGNLPLTSPGPGSGQLWNNGGFICVA